MAARKKKRQPFTQRCASELADAGKRAQFVFSQEMQEDVDDANRERLAGNLHASLTTVARLLKKEHKIPLAVETIMRKIKEHVGRDVW